MGKKRRKKLERKRRLAPKPKVEPKVVEQTREVSRRGFITKMAALSTLLGAGSWVYLSSANETAANTFTERSQLNTNTNEASLRINRINHFIANAENGMSNFENILMPKINEIANHHVSAMISKAASTLRIRFY